MFKANYLFTMQPVAVQRRSRPMRVSARRTSPQGSNTRNVLARISTTKRVMPGNYAVVSALYKTTRRADWSFKQRPVRPIFKVEV